jgi:hypothetical protein
VINKFAFALVLTVLGLSSVPVLAQREPQGVYNRNRIEEIDSACFNVCWVIPNPRDGLKLEVIAFYRNVVVGYYRQRNYSGKLILEQKVVFEVSERQINLIFKIMRKKRTGVIRWKDIYWVQSDKYFKDPEYLDYEIIQGG